MVSYEEYQFAKNRKNSILHSENKKKIGQVLKPVQKAICKFPQKDVCVSVKSKGDMILFIVEVAIYPQVQLSIW